MVARFPAGAVVTAYVNPVNPTEVVLVPGTQPGAIIVAAVFAVFFIGLGIYNC